MAKPKTELKLWFANMEPVRLVRTEFRHSRLSVAVKKARRGSERGNIKWTRGVQAICALLLRWAAWGARRREDNAARMPVLEGGKSSPASTLSYALGKEELYWVADLFGRNRKGERLLGELLVIRNRDFSAVKSEPISLAFDERLLPPDCIKVWVDGAPVSAAEKLAALAETIERNHLRGRGAYRWDGDLGDADEEAEGGSDDSAHQTVEPAPGLGKHWISFETFIEERTRDFVGRDFVFAAIRRFLANGGSDYFIIEGEPGIGKSAIMSWLVGESEFDCPVHHFNIASQGINTARQFVGNVCSRLVTHLGLPHAELPGDFCVDSAFLSKLLEEAAGRLGGANNLLIAVDALDEAAPAGIGQSENPLFLPVSLPPGIRIIATSRHGWERRFRFMHAEAFALDPSGEANSRDVREYIGWQVERDGIRQWIAERAIGSAEFTSRMLEKSEGNFMYLHYVLREMAQGSYGDRGIEGIPSGLQNYYDDHWRRMGMMARPLPRTKLKIIYVLCEAKKPVSCELLSDFAAEDAVAVQDVLDEWRQFLDVVNEEKQRRYSIYHSSFRDFLHRRDIVKAAGITLEGINEQIADSLLRGLPT